MYAIAKIYQETLTIGSIVTCDTHEEACEIAFAWGLDEYEERKLDLSGNTKEQLEIQAILKENNEYLFSNKDGDCVEGICEDNKALMIQIVLTDENDDE